MLSCRNFPFLHTFIDRAYSNRGGADGARRFISVGSGRTNDRGQYRLYWVTPGRYLLVTGISNMGTSFQAVESAGLGGSPNESGARDGVLFHPGVTDPNDAAFVVVQSATELRVDMVVPQQLYRVRGRVIDASSGQPLANAQINVQSPRILNTAETFARITPLYNPADGTFEMRNVPPGSYYANLTVRDTTAAGARPVRITVGSSDLNGVVLTLEPYATVPGRMSVEGQEFSSATNLRDLRVGLSLSQGGHKLTDTTYGLIGGGPTPAADGTFSLARVMPGEYLLSLSRLVGYYVKEARYRDSDVLNGPISVSSSEPGVLTIVLSNKVGQVTGTVVGTQLQPAPGVQAILIPDEHRDRAELYKTAITDSMGRFSIADVAPGNYRLFSWEALEPYGYFDPEIMKRSELRGTPVRVAESSASNVQVTMIPTE